jgi:hypothetical protein
MIRRVNLSLKRSSTTWIGHVEKVMNMDIFINYV